MITGRHLFNIHLLSTTGKHVLKYAKYKNKHVINNIGIIKIKH